MSQEVVGEIGAVHGRFDPWTMPEIAKIDVEDVEYHMLLDWLEDTEADDLKLPDQIAVEVPITSKGFYMSTVNVIAWFVRLPT